MALRWLLSANVAVTLAASAGFQIGTKVIRDAWFTIAVAAAFNIALFWLNLGWLPRIVERRLAAEMAEDPVRALRRRRRERWFMIVGLTVGSTVAWLAVFFGLLASNRL